MALCGVLLGGATAEAARLNRSYEGTYQSSAPSGYAAAPQASQVGQGVLYSFTVAVSGVGAPPSLTGDIRVQRVTTIAGRDVSSGDPAISEDSVLAGPAAGDPPRVLARLDRMPASAQWPPQAYTVSFVPGACGYYVVWAGRSDSFANPSEVLNAGVARVLGCAPGATAPPTSPPTPTGLPAPVLDASAFPPAPPVRQDLVFLASAARGGIGERLALVGYAVPLLGIVLGIAVVRPRWRR